MKTAGSRGGQGGAAGGSREDATQPPATFQLLASGREHRPGCVTCAVGTGHWAVDRHWRDTQLAGAHAFLRERIARRNRDVCVVVGNGPSLNRTDLSLLENQDVIISNNAFLSPELLRHAVYYTVVNYLVAEQSAPSINALTGVDKVIPYWLGYCLHAGPNTHFVNADAHPEFCTDPFRNLSWRHTVTFFNLHLAYGLGYRRVVMIGFDHHYRQPSGVMEREVIRSFEEDSNHFHPDYFRGKAWQAADVDRMADMYRLAGKAFEEDGREIVNATVGGHLEVFERRPLHLALEIESREAPPPAPPCRIEDGTTPPPTLKQANSLFRARDYAGALDSYLRLYRQKPLQMYADNACMAARKLGMEPDLEALLRRPPATPRDPPP